MDDKMETDHSYSGESSSSTDTSSGSSEGDEEEMEPVRILGHSLELPQELCEDYSLFKEFFSTKTWESLDEKHKEHLMKFLPKFTENQEEETTKTIEMLFHHEPFHFQSPFSTFYNNLRQGNYRPDIAKMKKFLKKARAKQQRHRIKSYYAKLLPEVLLSRERLLAAVKAAPPGPAPRIPSLPPKSSSKNNFKPLYLRAKQRYFEELAAIRSEVGGDESDDENYPDGPPEQFVKKKKGNNVTNADGNISGTLAGSEQTLPTSLECLKNVLIAHRSRRQYRENHPELNINGITLEDIKQRVALVNGAKKLMFGGPKIASPIQKIKKAPKKDAVVKKMLENKISKKCKEETENPDIKPLLQNIKIKVEKEGSDSESSFLENVMSPKQMKKHMEQVEIKQEIGAEPNYDDQFDALIKQEPPDSMPITNISKIDQPIPIKLEDLDGIDMMALPIELADDTGEVIKAKCKDRDELLDVDESLTETTHANFLSLVRALFPARAAHRASKQQLHARCAAVMRSPIAPLNTWYNSCDDWCAELDSALDFLAGERGPHPDDFVPYLQYMPENQMYQWIGAGRDCDAILGRLCERWLRAADEPSFIAEAPPPRYPTSWMMRTPTSFEVAEFRAQERRRFSSAGKPFTYIQHGYRSVVGPCARSWWMGATGAALLRAERPRPAAFPALVRDALARLPNGEGTRHHVLILLKMSQWIAPCSDQALLSAVSAALDKLNSIKRDPIVKYDQRTATWTYLHRNRTEEDWLKLSGRGKKFGATSFPSLPAPLTPPPVRLQTPAKERPLSPPRGVELEVANVEEVIEASDSDVDVDDTSTSVPHLSSAQLLMQATQLHKPTLALSNKPKGKLIAAASPKSKPQITKLPSNKQTNKQATLMTQSVKQASLMAATMKQVMTQAKVAQVKSQQTPKVSVSPPTPKQTNPQTKTVINSVAKQNATQVKTVCLPKTDLKSTPKQTKVALVKTSASQAATPATSLGLASSQISKSLPSLIVTPQKSPLMKQRLLQRTDTSPAIVTMASQKTPPTTVTLIHPTTETTGPQSVTKVGQGTRSLLIKPSAVQTTVTASTTIPSTQVTPIQRRGIVRVLSPATPSSGKSLISPRALMQTGTTTAKKRTIISTTASVTTVAQSAESKSTVSSSTPTAVTSSVTTRTIQLAGGRTVQLAANQTVHLPGGQAVQLSSGHTLQLSSLQLPMHSVRLPSGQTVQLASPQTMQAVRVSNAAVKTSTVRSQQSASVVKNLQTSQSTVQIPVSTVQLAGQTVQIAGQTVQLAGQSVQLTGHTVKLPSGQSVQVASQSVLPSQSVQLPSGQTVQLTGGNVQTLQLTGSNVQNSQISSGQSVQLSSQTVQLGGQTVQLPGGQTLQLSAGQTVQLSSGQTLQLASGQTVHLANQGTKSVAQVIRSQAATDKATSAQPIVAKLLTNAQGQMVSVEGGVRGGVRVLAPAARLARPLLLTAAKPLHNIILQQSDGTRVPSSGGSSSPQTLVLSNLGAQTVSTSTTTAPVLKLQQAGTNATVATSSGVRSVVMDGQQLKLVGGRHVLARILRPAHQPP
ncbi:nuclear factor related to kappa-B-binding protein isoform X2 [Bombyx mandarina]|uniref:Nuclear factor related to kappa-B-binding protein isoform X2 n=1 Tax=Bombyx mandarina TaxID=7092 RepID=A0A6J2KII2_BOMMA|nr:nuclear factor related to kappa-B-binding protein isoform X2 [Bombyx mandarina]